MGRRATETKRKEMSGVYIKDLGMPQTCFKCKLSRITPSYYAFCSLNEKCYPANETPPSDCPLVPVPPHGDLIDRDAMLDTATIHWSQTTNESCFPIDEIEDAPTIIPADGKDTDVPTREECE